MVARSLVNAAVRTVSAASVLLLCGCEDAGAHPQGDAPPPQRQQSPASTSPPTAAPAQTPAQPNATDTPAKRDSIAVTLAGRQFTLDLALDDQTRFRGLSGQTDIPADGGLMFVFRNVGQRAFVMRDCPVPIDIIYVEKSGRITAMHHMLPEAPRTDAEKTNSPPYRGAPEWQFVNEAYENRLKKYPSRFDCSVVIELRGGTINIDGAEREADKPKPGIVLKVGDKLDLDVPKLMTRAK
jgi:uncharacterized membrane protein (UPF0127 family)